VSQPPAPSTSKPVLLRKASDFGMTRSQLRGRRWQRASRGLFAPSGSLACLTDRARAYALILPAGSGFGHLTGAALRAWWLPWLPAALPMFATTCGRVHIQRDGLYVRRSRLTKLESFDGLPVVTASDCLLELAVDLSLVDLVPLVDVALRARHCTLDQAWTVAMSRRPGAANLRRALQLGDPRSESAWESILRLVHVTAPARPRPRQALARLAYQRYGYTAAEIVRRSGQIIADAEQAFGLAHDPNRHRRWLFAAAQSTLTPQGRRRLRRRLERYSNAHIRPKPQPPP
jgi:hypothetical protein